MNKFRILSLACFVLILEIVACKSVVSSGNSPSSDQSHETGKNKLRTTPAKGTSEKLLLDPDVELIDVNTQENLEEKLYRESAIANGMDPEAVIELLRTRKPVVRTSVEPDGKKITVTYSLRPDGTVTRHTKTEYQPKVITRTYEYPRRRQPPIFPQNSFDNNDWSWNSHGVNNVPRQSTFPSTTHNWPPIPSLLPGGPHSELPMSNGDGFNVQLPQSWDTNTWFDSDVPHTVTKTFIDDQGRKVTTTHTVGPTVWRTNVINGPPSTPTIPTHKFPHTNTFPTVATTTAKPVTGKTEKGSIPNLDDFLEAQYGTTTKKPKTNKKSVPTTARPVSSTPPVKEIKVEDLPVMEILPIDKFSNTGVMMRPVGDDKVITTLAVENIPEGKKFEIPQGPFLVGGSGVTKKPTHKDHSVPLFPTIAAEPDIDQRFKPTFTHPTAKPRHGIAKAPENPIDAFLAKVGIKPRDIEKSHGELVKTFTDERGRILTVTLVLSTLKEPVKDNKPLK